MTPASLSGRSATDRDAGGGLAAPIALVILAMACFQLGGALSKQLFPLVGPLGAAALRMTFSAGILGVLDPPWRLRGIGSPAALGLVAFGVALSIMTLGYYLALQRIPLGVAVAINFTGPLGVAVAGSRRPADLAWVALAAGGLLLLLPLSGLGPALDPLGVVCACCSAAACATYVTLGRRLGRSIPSQRMTAAGLLVGAAVLLPVGIVEAGPRLLTPAALPIALVIAAVCTALPYRLEVAAMQRLPATLFGVLLSLEPAVAALYGWLMLGERLAAVQLAAIVAIMAASAGATLTARRRR